MLAEAEKAADAGEREEAALSAWFAALYAHMRNELNYQDKARLEPEIAACLARAAKLLGIEGNARKYQDIATPYLKGKLPDRCGIGKGVVPVIGDIQMLIVDDGVGGRRTFYYHTPKNEDELDCGKIQGAMCFEILNSMHVTSAMRQAGVKGETMTFIEHCVVPD